MPMHFAKGLAQGGGPCCVLERLESESLDALTPLLWTGIGSDALLHAHVATDETPVHGSVCAGRPSQDNGITWSGLAGPEPPLCSLAREHLAGDLAGVQSRNLCKRDKFQHEGLW